MTVVELTEQLAVATKLAIDELSLRLDALRTIADRDRRIAELEAEQRKCRECVLRKDWEAGGYRCTFEEFREWYL